MTSGIDQSGLETASLHQLVDWILLERGPNYELTSRTADFWKEVISHLVRVRDGLLSDYDDLLKLWPARGGEAGLTREAFLRVPRDAIGTLNRMLAKIEDNEKLLRDLLDDVMSTSNAILIHAVPYPFERYFAEVKDGLYSSGSLEQDKVTEKYRLGALARMRPLNEHYLRVAAALARSDTETWSAERGNPLTPV